MTTQQQQPRTKLTDLPVPEQDDVSGYAFGFSMIPSSFSFSRLGPNRGFSRGGFSRGGPKGGLVAHEDNKYI